MAIQLDILMKVEDVIRTSNVVHGDAKDLETKVDGMAGRSHLELIETLFEIGKAYDALDVAKKALNNSYDKLSREMVPDAMRAAGVKTVTVEGIGRVTISNRFSVSMLDKIAGIEWLRSHDLGGLVVETVNSSTLAATAKDLLENKGVELPDNIFKSSTSPYTSITKVK